MSGIEKPKRRGKFRQIVGKEYFIFKRKIKWIFSNTKWAKQNEKLKYNNIVFEHKSLILRPLMGVDMILQENKRTNLQIAIQHLNKIVIKPNETFSVWKNVGRPTKNKGYLPGLVLKQGKVISGTGGGLCQLGNLLFWIFVHSPLTVTERYRHGFDVFPSVNRKVPFGAGATLSYNYIDLQVKNETQNEFQIILEIDNDYLYGKLLSKDVITSTYKVEERNHIIKQQFWGGYSRHNVIVQTETRSNGKQIENIVAVNNAIMMYNPILEHKTRQE